MKFSNLGNEHILAGIFPDSLLCATFNCSKLSICPIDSGNGPTSSLKLTSKTFKFLSNPISGGKHVFKPTFTRIISSKVPAIFDKLEGRQPLSSLFANTITETGEFPIFSGNDERNLLLLINKASSFKSKRAFGISPWNSLNRMSRYLRDVKQRSTEGN